MNPSAATVMLGFAKDRYRIVRDANTARIFGAPIDGERPFPIERLVPLLDRAYSDETGRVAPAGAAAQVVDLLSVGDLPVEEIEVEQPVDAEDTRAREEERLEELGRKCARLRTSDDILALFDAELRADGFAGDTHIPRLVLLSSGSALLEIGRDGFSERIVSIKVDGPSSAGKNYAVDAAVAYLPDDAVIRLTGMSQKALVYGERPLERRFLYFPEGAGIRDDSDAAIFLRSLLAEGEIRYEVTVVPPGAVPVTETIVRSGPTAALITTSAVRLDRDLDNRLLRVSVDDSEELTRRIIERHGERAARGGTPARDRSEWHALNQWLMLQAPIAVRIPFAPLLAAEIPATAVRLRRDVQTVFSLTGAHAALHLESRERDDDGYVIATGADYTAARDLVDAILGTNADHAVPIWAQETWDAVPEVAEEAITYARLGRVLGIGTDAARTRALRLEESGLLTNLETRWKRPAKLIRGDTIPAGQDEFLPRFERLHDVVEAATERSPEPGLQSRDATGDHDRVAQPEPEPEPTALRRLSQVLTRVLVIDQNPRRPMKTATAAVVLAIATMGALPPAHGDNTPQGCATSAESTSARTVSPPRLCTEDDFRLAQAVSCAGPASVPPWAGSDLVSPPRNWECRSNISRAAMIIEARLTDNDIERVALRVVELLGQAHDASERWLDVAGAAEHLRLSEEAIRGMIKRQRLPVHKTENGRLRFSVSELDEWVRSGLAKSDTRTYHDRP